MTNTPTSLLKSLYLALPLFGWLSCAAPTSPSTSNEPRDSPDKIQNYPSSCQNACDGVTPNQTDPISMSYYCDNCICNNKLLGPANFVPASNFTDFFIDWKPLDSQCPQDWLCTWTNWASAGPFNNTAYYFPQNLGFKGCAETVTVEVGTHLDRFGQPNGSWLATPETPFAERAIPPSNLNVFSGSTLYNYWQYEVKKPFLALYGKVLPWFGQPGGGDQWYVEGGLGPLIDNGSLVLVAAKTYDHGESDSDERVVTWRKATPVIMKDNEWYH